MDTIDKSKLNNKLLTDLKNKVSTLYPEIYPNGYFDNRKKNITELIDSNIMISEFSDLITFDRHNRDIYMEYISQGIAVEIRTLDDDRIMYSLLDINCNDSSVVAVPELIYETMKSESNILKFRLVKLPPVKKIIISINIYDYDITEDELKNELNKYTIISTDIILIVRNIYIKILKVFPFKASMRCESDVIIDWN